MGSSNWLFAGYEAGNAKVGASAADRNRLVVDPQAALGAPRRAVHAATHDQSQRRQAQPRAAIGLGIGRAIDDLIVAALLESLRRLERPSTISQQPLQPGAVRQSSIHKQPHALRLPYWSSKMVNQPQRQRTL